MGRFDYVKYDADIAETQAAFKGKFEELEASVDRELRDGRAKALVMTKLEEAYMWIGKSLRDHQVTRSAGNAELNESRG
jgi:hypothetical protein